MKDQPDRTTEITSFKIRPVAAGVRRHLFSQRASIAAASLLSTTIAFGQAGSGAQLEEIVVTATKRTQNLQDVPIAIQVLDTQRLEELGIKSFDDYVAYLPSVSFTARGPGQSQVYMRG